MKIKLICKESGIKCDDFVYHGKNKHLPPALKHHPQHILYDDKEVKLCYFKSSYDNMYVELWKPEVTSFRQWHNSIQPLIIMVYNYTLDKYTIFDMNFINREIYSCRRDRNSYLLPNVSFQWRYEREKFTLS